jgi:hypothetical protein
MTTTDPEVLAASAQWRVPPHKIAPRSLTDHLPSRASRNRATKAAGFKNWVNPTPCSKHDCPVFIVNGSAGTCMECNRTVVAARYRENPEFRDRLRANVAARAAAKRTEGCPKFRASQRACVRRRRELTLNAVPNWLANPTTPEHQAFAVAGRARQAALKADQVYLQRMWPGVDLEVDHIVALAGRRRGHRRVASGLGIAINLMVRPADENSWKSADLDRAEQLDSLIAGPWDVSCADITRAFAAADGELVERPVVEPIEFAPALVRYHARLHAGLYDAEEGEEDRW